MVEKTRNARFVELGPDGWVEHHGDLYRVPVHLTAEGGGAVAAAARLAGVVGRGATPAEALEDAGRQAAAVIRAAKAAGRPIPWTDPVPAPPGAVTRYLPVSLSDPG